MKFIRLIFNLINFFLIFFIIFKVYNWYAPLTGLDLPQLTIYEVFAVHSILSLVLLTIGLNVQTILQYTDLKDEKGNDINKIFPITKTIVLLIYFFIMYLIKIFIY